MPIDHRGVFVSFNDRCARCSCTYKEHGNTGRCPHGATRYAHFIPRPKEVHPAV
jgi:hypothetical protein